jgi:hypothetical protein
MLQKISKIKGRKIPSPPTAGQTVPSNIAFAAQMGGPSIAKRAKN